MHTRATRPHPFLVRLFGLYLRNPTRRSTTTRAPPTSRMRAVASHTVELSRFLLRCRAHRHGGCDVRAGYDGRITGRRPHARRADRIESDRTLANSRHDR